MTLAAVPPPLPRRNLESIGDAVLMLVDDDELNVGVLQARLQDAGYRHFVTTSEPSEALDLVRQRRPDILLLDLHMPEVSGLEILAAIRSDPLLTGLAVLVVTASTDHQARLKALTLGATDFLQKPVDPAELVLRLKNTLEAKAWRDRLARTDLRSGLPNLTAATELLHRAIAQAQRDTLSVAVLQVAVDGFGDVQTLGAGAGDALLQELGRRLESAVRESDLVASNAADGAMVARDGEAFCVVLPQLKDGANAVLVAHRLQHVVRVPLECAGHELTPTCSVGIAVHPNDAVSASDLLSLARAALNQARREGDGNVRCYAADMNARALERIALVSDLRRASGRGELFLHYQPKRDVHTSEVVGAEALLRWQHPLRGLVAPGEFIPIAEETDLIIELGEWVLRQVVRQLRQWRTDGWVLPRISVNVSTRQLTDRRLLEALDEMLHVDSWLPGHLCFELTEGVMLQEAELAAGVLPALRSRGVQLSLDDFGTGYSCLAYLQRLRFDELKIDRSFVVALTDGGAPLVTAIIAMGRALGFRIVAEGVETETQLRWLQEAGCDEYQGWLGSRPMAADQFVQHLVRANAQPLQVGRGQPTGPGPQS